MKYSKKLTYKKKGKRYPIARFRCEIAHIKPKMYRFKKKPFNWFRKTRINYPVEFNYKVKLRGITNIVSASAGWGFQYWFSADEINKAAGVFDSPEWGGRSLI